MHSTFVDFEKAFTLVFGDAAWWARGKLGIPEWLVKIVLSMCKNVLEVVWESKRFSLMISWSS